MGEITAEGTFQACITKEVIIINVLSQQIKDLSDHDRLKHTEYNGYSGTTQPRQEPPFVFYKVLIKRGQVFHIR